MRGVPQGAVMIGAGGWRTVYLSDGLAYKVLRHLGRPFETWRSKAERIASRYKLVQSAGIDSPQLPRVRKVFPEAKPGEVQVIMEAATGPRLRDVIPLGDACRVRALRSAIVLSDLLAAAGLVARGISIENVLLGPGGVVTLVDYGEIFRAQEVARGEMIRNFNHAILAE